jgi:pyridoxal biosynthesis lyase PdxS
METQATKHMRNIKSNIKREVSKKSNPHQKKQKYLKQPIATFEETKNTRTNQTPN